MMSHIHMQLLIVIILVVQYVFTTPTQKEEHVESKPNYRLKNFCTPSYYIVNLDLSAEAFTDQSDTFIGSIKILLECPNRTNELSLHADHNFINISSIAFDYRELASKDYTIDETTDTLTVNLTSFNNIMINSYDVLEINYTSRLSSQDMYGFYKINYKDKDGLTKYVATTQFQPTYARRAFPCFDEPDKKAIFWLTLTIPKDMKVLFNTEVSYLNESESSTTIVFNPTPIMSTYLFAIVVSEFSCTPGTPVDSVSYRVCSRNETAERRNFALEVGPEILDNLNSYTNYNYSNMMSQLDQVAIPNFAAGGMENWGLVTYRETGLLLDDQSSTVRNKQGVATTIAHELAHQWFGNLVTIKWWSELFLNEGIARYFEYHAVHELFSEWELDKQFLIGIVQPALRNDELENAQALESECSSPEEIAAKFGVSSYNKGASIVNMVKHMIGENKFKTGLQEYIQTYKYNNTEPKNLWEILNKTIEAAAEFPANLNVILENWTKLSGFPLLTVETQGTNIAITQKSSIMNSTSKWYVPISYTKSNDKFKFVTTSPTDWLSPSENSTEIYVDQFYKWVILNNQATGYYRVNYDDRLWTKIGAALREDNFDGIVEQNRAQIVDDLFYLAKVDLQKYSKVLDILVFLANDTSIFSWSPAFEGFNHLLKRVGANSKLGQEMSKNILESIRKIYESAPITKINDTEHIYTLKQVLVVAWACKLGHEQCIKEVQELFVNYINTRKRPDVNLESVVYCYGLRYSKNCEKDWIFLWDQYKNTSQATEKLNILSALSCTKDSSLLNDLLSLSINNSNIRSQDVASIFTSVYRNPDGLDIALEFLTKYYQKIGEKYQEMGVLENLIKGIADYFTTETQVTKLKEFIKSANLPEDFKIAANTAVEIAEKNLKWQAKFSKDLEDFYKAPEEDGAASLTISTMFMFLAVIFCKLLY